MRRKKTTPAQASPVTDDPALQKIEMLTYVMNTTGIIGNLSYNLTSRFIYIHFAPDFLVSFKELSQILVTCRRLNLSDPCILFRENLIRISL